MEKEERIKQLVEKMRAGDVRSLSRLMTLVETEPESLPDVMRHTYALRGRSRRVALAGPPGAGKSTLITNLIRHAGTLKLRTGVLCVDPTSPLTGGAILGDRVRMSLPDMPAEAFIRSVASGDSLGGLAAATRFHTLLLEASGVDLVIIETVGLGQVGYDARRIADSLVLVLVPESGDTVQSLKSGILELADIVVVNKADREGADEIAHTLRSALEEPREGWSVPVVSAVALKNEGTDELWARLDEHAEFLRSRPGGGESAPLADMREAMLFMLRSAMTDEFFRGRPLFSGYVGRIERGEIDPFSAAREIWRELLKNQ